MATLSAPTWAPALSILRMHPQLQEGCRATQAAESGPPGSAGLCWVLGTEGLIAGTLSDAALSPMPSPHTHLSAPRSSPASKE